MSGFNPAIKQEPADDDFQSSSLFVPVDSIEEDDEPAFVDPATILQRAPNHEGRPFPTVCFDSPHLEHPHHHRLICGHDIMTRKIERCGRNCQTTKDKKVAGVGFHCPHQACRRQPSLFMPKRGEPQPRRCTPSHVYGLDLEADRTRKAEKDEQVVAELEATGIELRNRKIPHPRTAPTGRMRSMSPKGRVIKNTKAKAINVELEMLKMTRDMDKSQMATREERRELAKKTADLEAEEYVVPDEVVEALQEAESEPMLDFTHQCADCKHPINNVRQHCFDCADFDLCIECFEDGTYKHPAQHRFKALDCSSDGWRGGESGTQATFCECGTTSTSFLVLCTDCEIPFHPGCIGAGAFREEDYELKYLSRGGCMRWDYLNWKGGKAFRCKPCQEASDIVANTKTTRELRMIERANKRLDNAKQGIRSPEPEPRPKKRAAQSVEDDLASLFGESEAESVRALSVVETEMTEAKDGEGDGEEEGRDDDGMPPDAKRFRFDLPMRFRATTGW